jgi:peptide-methionine (S)-S-oxide reductase
LPFSFCAKENVIVPKSLETKNMEKQGDLEIATFAGGCTEAVFYSLTG